MVSTDQIIVTAIAGLSPIMFSYIFKNFDNKNQSNIRKKVLDEAQKRIDLLNTYYEAQNKFLNTEALTALKVQLANELSEVKKKVNEMYESQPASSYHKLNLAQKIFLTFLPISKWGWVWHILFYINALLITFAFVGYFTDDNGNFSSDAFSRNIQDENLIIGTMLFLGTLLLFYILALNNYRKNSLRNTNKK